MPLPATVEEADQLMAAAPPKEAESLAGPERFTVEYADTLFPKKGILERTLEAVKSAATITTPQPTLERMAVEATGQVPELTKPLAIPSIPEIPAGKASEAPTEVPMADIRREAVQTSVGQALAQPGTPAPEIRMPMVEAGGPAFPYVRPPRVPDLVIPPGVSDVPARSNLERELRGSVFAKPRTIVEQVTETQPGTAIAAGWADIPEMKLAQALGAAGVSVDTKQQLAEDLGSNPTVLDKTLRSATAILGSPMSMAAFAWGALKVSATAIQSSLARVFGPKVATETMAGILSQSAAGAGRFASYEGVSNASGQLARWRETGEAPSLAEFSKAVGRGAVIGAAMGPAGSIPAAPVRVAAEAGTLATAPALLEGRLPTVNDLIDAGTLIAALHLTNLPASVLTALSKPVASRTVADNAIVEDVRRNLGQIGNLRLRYQPEVALTEAPPPEVVPGEPAVKPPTPVTGVPPPTEIGVTKVPRSVTDAIAEAANRATAREWILRSSDGRVGKVTVSENGQMAWQGVTNPATMRKSVQQQPGRIIVPVPAEEFDGILPRNPGGYSPSIVDANREQFVRDEGIRIAPPAVPATEVPPAAPPPPPEEPPAAAEPVVPPPVQPGPPTGTATGSAEEAARLKGQAVELRRQADWLFGEAHGEGPAAEESSNRMQELLREATRLETRANAMVTGRVGGAPEATLVPPVEPAPAPTSPEAAKAEAPGAARLPEQPPEATRVAVPPEKSTPAPVVPEAEPKIEPSPFSTGQRVEVQTPKGWVPGTVQGVRAGGVDENFQRVDVKADNGAVYDGAHPESVRPLAAVRVPATPRPPTVMERLRRGRTVPPVSRPVGQDSRQVGAEIRLGTQDADVLSEMADTVKTIGGEVAGKVFDYETVGQGGTPEVRGFKTGKPDWMRVAGTKKDYYHSGEVLDVIESLMAGKVPTTPEALGRQGKLSKNQRMAEQIVQALRDDAETEKARLEFDKFRAERAGLPQAERGARESAAREAFFGEVDRLAAEEGTTKGRGPAEAARPNVAQPEMFTGREMIGPAVTPGGLRTEVRQATTEGPLFEGRPQPEPELPITPTPRPAGEGGTAAMAAVNRAEAPSAKAASRPPSFRQRVIRARERTAQTTAMKAVNDAVSEAADDIKAMVAPAVRTEQSREASRVLREHLGGNLAQRTDRAYAALQTARAYFGKQDAGPNMAWFDRAELGEAQPTPELQRFNDVARGLLDGRRNDVQALGEGKLQAFFENYMPHIYKNPEEAGKFFAQWFAKRPFEGGKGFLKKRSIPTMLDAMFPKGAPAGWEGMGEEQLREAIHAQGGLEPASYNPVDLVLHKTREMDKFITSHQAIAELSSMGSDYLRYKPVFQEMPEGYARINDSAFRAYGKPTITVKEAYDKEVVDRLNLVLNSLGIRSERKPRIGGQRWGFAEEGAAITTKFGGPESVIMHELGHTLDRRYNLWDELVRGAIGQGKRGVETKTASQQERVKIQKELRALADLRYEGQEPEKAFKEYVRERTEQIANAFMALLYAPQRMGDVAPTVKTRLEVFLRSKPELKSILDVKPSLVLGEAAAEIPHGGLLLHGEWIAPEPVARLINNHLSPGLRGKPVFQAYLGLGNVLNQFQLGWSAFHLGFTTLDAATSRFALGLYQATHGNPIKGAETALTTATAPFTGIVQGDRILKEWYSPGSQSQEIAKVADGVRMAGGRVRQDPFYRTNITGKMMDAVRSAAQPGRSAISRIVKGGKAVVLSPFALTEQAIRPVLEYVVPRQKLAVFADMYRYELERLGPEATQQQIREAAARAWDSADNRMGQLVYDNLFWNKTTKDLALASVRSVGWNLGTYREIAGGARDVLRGDPSFRASYIVALPVVIGTLGSILNYLWTGEGPKELRDYFFPRTGNTDERGRPERVSLPSYIKDIYHYWKEPYRTVANKIHPLAGMITDMLQNRDFYGTKIRNEDDPAIQQALDVAKHVGTTMIPLAVRGLEQQKKTGASPMMQALPFIGVTRAPASIIRSDAENLASEYMRARQPEGSRTKEEAQRADYLAQIRRGRAQQQPTGELEREAISKRAVSLREVLQAKKQAGQSILVRSVPQLSASEALNVYEVSTPEERRAIRHLVQRKVITAAQHPAQLTSTIRQKARNLGFAVMGGTGSSVQQGAIAP